MSTYSCTGAYYRQNGGSWWSPLSGSRLPTGWSATGTNKYETRLSFDFASIRSTNTNNYITGARFHYYATSEYSSETVYIRLTNSNYSVIASGSSGQNADGGWAYITLSSDMINALTNGATTYLGTYGENNGSYIEIYSTATQVAYLEIDWSPRITACTAPTSCSLNTTISETSAILSWSGATSGTNNAITGYYIEYADSLDGANYGAWQALTNAWTSSGGYAINVDAPSVRGTYRTYKVATLGSAGSSYYSGFAYCANSVRKNRLPNTPVVNTDSTNHPESNYTISWGLVSDPDGQSVTYFVTRGVWNGTSYDYLSDIEVSGASYSWSISGYSRGQRLYMTVRARDSLGAFSPSAGTGVEITRNQSPVLPTISFPINGSITYNKQPRVGVVLSTDPDNDLVCGYMSINGVESDSNGANQSYWSQTGLSPSGTQIVVRGVTVPDGSRGIGYLCYDTVRALSPVANSNITVLTPSWTDSTIVSGITKPKLEHISELRTAINNVRNYYGLNAYVWSIPNLVRGETLIKDTLTFVTEMRDAIQEIIDYVNSFDNTNTTHNIEQPVWTDSVLVPEEFHVKAVYISEIRAIIPTL